MSSNQIMTKFTNSPQYRAKHSFSVMVYFCSGIERVRLANSIMVFRPVERTTPKPMSDASVVRMKESPHRGIQVLMEKPKLVIVHQRLSARPVPT